MNQLFALRPPSSDPHSITYAVLHFLAALMAYAPTSGDQTVKERVRAVLSDIHNERYSLLEAEGELPSSPQQRCPDEVRALCRQGAAPAFVHEVGSGSMRQLLV